MHFTTTTESASSNGTSQRKCFRSPTIDNQEDEPLSDQYNQSHKDLNTTSQQPPIDNFDLHFPQLGTVSYSTSNAGSPLSYTYQKVILLQLMDTNITLIPTTLQTPMMTNTTPAERIIIFQWNIYGLKSELPTLT